LAVPLTGTFTLPGLMTREVLNRKEEERDTVPEKPLTLMMFTVE